MIDEVRRQRVRRVIDDFFRNKPPGTRVEQHEWDAYVQRLREAAKEVHPVTDDHPLEAKP